MKPDYKLVQNTLLEKLVDINKLIKYLDDSEFDTNAHNLVMSLLEITFSIEHAIKDSKELSK